MMTNINGTYVFSYRDSYYMYDYNCSVILQIEETAFDTIIKHQNHQTITHDEKELIDSLYECGFLHEFNIDDQRESSEETIAYLTFAPVYNCNLRCTYCFGNHGDNFKNPKKQFDKDTFLGETV